MWPLRQSKSRPDWRDGRDETEEGEEGDRQRERHQSGDGIVSNGRLKKELRPSPTISVNVERRNILKANNKMHGRLQHLVRNLLNEAPTVLQVGRTGTLTTATK